MKKYILIFSVVILTALLRYDPGKAIPAAAGRRILRDSSPLISMMTYNIHRGINKNGKLDLDGIAAVLKSSGAGIIAVQEVERFSIRTGFKDQIRYLADKLSMQYAFGRSIHILNGQYGNGLLSKYPIEEYEVIRLYSEGEQRTLLRAVLNVDGKHLTVYNTHLGLGQAEREKQLKEMMKLASGEENLIIAGDFNSKADKLEVVTAGLKDSGAIWNAEDRATFDESGLTERIDYIFASEDIKIKSYEVLETEASDHYPVISSLMINN